MNDLATRVFFLEVGPRVGRAREMPRVRCDRCDGFHPSEKWPQFRKPREDHRDARPLPQNERPPLVPDSPVLEATGSLEKQLMDGSCLYHSLVRGERALGLPSTSHVVLRSNLASWVRENGRRMFNGKSVAAWLHLELGREMHVATYAARQAKSGPRPCWGGPLEILAFVLSKKVNVWVWVPARRRGKFRRTSCFNVPDGSAVSTINLCHSGGTHYDFLWLVEPGEQVRNQASSVSLLGRSLPPLLSTPCWHAQHSQFSPPTLLFCLERERVERERESRERERE